jgi:hypothetical protein
LTNRGSRELNLWQAAKDTLANSGVLVKLFNRIEGFFERLKIYIEVPPPPATTEELAKIMAEVLSILGIATKGMKERKISRSIFCSKLLLAQLDQNNFSRTWQE